MSVTFKGIRLEWDDPAPRHGAIYRFHSTTKILTQVSPVIAAMPVSLPAAHLDLTDGTVLYVSDAVRRSA